MLAPLVGGLALVAYLVTRKGRIVSAGQDEPEDSTTEPLEAGVIEYETSEDEPLADILGDAIGSPYYYGRGTPSTPWADLQTKGADCSGAVQMALVKLGKLSSKAADRSVVALANDSDPIAFGSQVPGDIAFYSGHAMLVYSYPRADGHSAVWGMHGGGKSDKGNNPAARLDVMKSANYWPHNPADNTGFLTYGRLRA